jgi:hypothetical protein
MKSLKPKPKTTIGDEIAMQIRGTGGTFTITMTEDHEGCESVILKDNECGDITIIQEYGEGPKVMFLDTNEVAAIKAILL